MPSDQVTRLLRDWKSGNQSSIDELTALVYEELRRLARSYLRNESAAFTIQPTVLVHEAYLRLAGQQMPDWQSRSHFFGVAAHLMRQILVDHARKHRSAKRGSGATPVSFDQALNYTAEKMSELVVLDDALAALHAIDPRKCKVIELRFFGGLSAEETAQALGISVATVGREQRMAEAWLHREMSVTE